MMFMEKMYYGWSLHGHLVFRRQAWMYEQGIKAMLYCKLEKVSVQIHDH